MSFTFEKNDVGTGSIPEGSTGSSQQMPAPISGAQWLLLLAVLVVLCGLRFVHLGADMPGWLRSFSAGEFVDEGYKTLSPRNLALYGKTHWHELDNYTGWMETSPITNWSYFGAFKAFGVELESARAVTIAFYIAFLLACLWALRDRYTFPVLLTGLAMVAIDPALFAFSRVALIEVPMVLFIYGWLLVFVRRAEGAIWLPLVAALVTAPFLTEGIKRSALVYLAPMIGALLFRAALLRGLFRSHRTVAWLGLAVLAIGTLLFATRGTWLRRFDANPLGYLTNVLTNPIVQVTPFLFLTGWLCALHLLLSRPAEVLQSGFRTAIVGLVLLGPLALGFFPYDPPRYYVPMLPAFAMAIWEWLGLKPWKAPITQSKWLLAIGFAGVLVWFVLAARAVNFMVLMNLPLEMGDHPGLGDKAVVYASLLPAAIAAGLFLAFRKHPSAAFTARVAVLGSVSLLFVVAFVRISAFLLHPSYESHQVRAAIARTAPADSVVIGDWAPFFTLGTELRALYMADSFNPVSRITDLRPDYFLHSETTASRESLAGFGELGGVRLGSPILNTQYRRWKMTLYPIRYDTGPGEGRSDLRNP